MYINDLRDNNRVSSEKWSNISEVLQRGDDIAGMFLGIEFHLQAPVRSSGRKNAFLSQLANCGRKTWVYTAIFLSKKPMGGLIMSNLTQVHTSHCLGIREEQWPKVRWPSVWVKHFNIHQHKPPYPLWNKWVPPKAGITLSPRSTTTWVSIQFSFQPCSVSRRQNCLWLAAFPQDHIQFHTYDECLWPMVS